MVLHFRLLDTKEKLLAGTSSELAFWYFQLQITIFKAFSRLVRFFYQAFDYSNGSQSHQKRLSASPEITANLSINDEHTPTSKPRNQGNVHDADTAVESLHSRWNSSVRVIVDRPPSQPPSHRQMSGGQSSDSVKERHKYPGVGDAHRQGNAFERLQRQSDSKWTSDSGVITDKPPLKPLRRLGPSSVLALEHSLEMKNHDIFETTNTALGTLTGTGLQCAARTA
jgi:hypothetical protein